ncbi:histidine kinase [Heterostelium album PN500]|uniref:Histidine kinase n=1 Tax=Heterostelium pallidum (strain ATCC 26659 / Pp 5 / PN500) TaxID=670386 RepID=D3B6L6_HETP5|nr:histidine kinase [Heterostelium album PN500]EFA82986.1 histidine kinase [Heterostelium album PN500]|eukprot:XP_020435103.1 histidine kinase [Heterostelium album PN500]
MNLLHFLSMFIDRLDMIAHQMIFVDLRDWITYTVFATILYFISKQLIHYCLSHIFLNQQPTSLDIEFNNNNNNNNNNIIDINNNKNNSSSSSSSNSNGYGSSESTQLIPNPILTEDEIKDLERLASSDKFPSVTPPRSPNPPSLTNSQTNMSNKTNNSEISSIVNDPMVLLCNISFGGGVIIDQNLHIVFVLEGTKDIFPDYQQLNQQHPSFLELIEEDYREQFVHFFQISNIQQQTRMINNNNNNQSSQQQLSPQLNRVDSLHNLNQLHNEPIILRLQSTGSTFITVELKLTAIYYDDVVSQLQSAVVDDESKIDILSHISHELRTPISSIVASVQLFRATEVTSLQREYLSLIDSSTTSLLELISNVLDHDKMGAGKLLLNTVDFNLSTLIEDVCAMVSTQALRKGIEVASYIFTHCPLSIYGDPVRLRQILLNLLSNGIKFTEKGQVLVRVEPLEVCDTSLTLKFEVRDTGMGISKENLPKLFKKYSQFNSKMSSGHGLGLAISKDLVQLMGGKIWCDSKPGNGCSFFFTLKFDTPQKQLPCPVPNFNKLNVLIVDPNESIRSVVTDYLREWNCKTVETSDVSRAIKEIKSRNDEHIELVIVDVDSTTLKSFLKLKRIMDIEYSGKIGLIMMSKDRSMVHGIGVGNTSKLTKPIRQSHLVACILASMPEYHLQSPELTSSMPSNTKKLPIKAFDSQPLYDYSKLSSSSHYQKEFSAKNLATCIPPYLKSDSVSPLSSDSLGSSSESTSSPDFESRAGGSHDSPNNNSQLGMRRVTRRHSIDIVTFDHIQNRNASQIRSIHENSGQPAIADISPIVSPKQFSIDPASQPTASPQDHQYFHYRQSSAPHRLVRSPSQFRIDPMSNIRGSNFSDGSTNDHDSMDFGNGSSSSNISPPHMEINATQVIPQCKDSHQQQQQQTNQQQQQQQHSSNQNTNEPTILVVDDCLIHLKLVKRVLESSLGLSVICVGSGEEALEQFEKHQFAAILMDCEMSGMDGYTCTKFIRQRETEKTVASIKSGLTPHVPIIAMTAHSPNDTTNRTKCISSGMDDYITKPFEIDHLLSIVKKWFEFYNELNSQMNERIQRTHFTPRNDSDTESTSSPSDEDSTEDTKGSLASATKSPKSYNHIQYLLQHKKKSNQLYQNNQQEQHI